ncbi:heavy-metal-associated domain-containing protein [Vannielia litorea]|uniref:heavy-metal-associated domain-containing protein n=1 Tax=Vannielia litorea TaxID=1217970 RepID=UPI001BCD42C0|nr:heavy-metal-associated domain-containing protein [Vannielia litorea]MBS8226040.1 copper chaperone [Vannielia litorea]
MKFHVPNMSCGHCTAAISKSIKTTDPTAQVDTDLETRTVSVETTAQPHAILQSIKSAGYEASPA